MPPRTFQSTPSWRGRPLSNIPDSYYSGISIHALVKRATKMGWYSFAQTAISIHALVKRATASWLVRVCSLLYFNPRPREEGDIGVDFSGSLWIRFQSTPSWRGRPWSKEAGKWDHLFQSTPSWRGRLPQSLSTSPHIFISIHALVKRATWKNQEGVADESNFNPRPREEGDQTDGNVL